MSLTNTVITSDNDEAEWIHGFPAKSMGRGQGYGLRPLEQGSSSRTTDVQTIDPRLQSLFVEKDELVGIKSVSTDLVAKLVEGASTRLIISLVGEGGIGKTTLAKNVYENEVVKRHFESARAWITVSRPYNPTKVLKQMKEEFCKSGECTVGELDPTDKLIDCVKKALQTKRYVIFLDDVWEENFWGVIKLALPNNNEGSRVIITTRNAAVANSCKETPHDPDRINLQPWSPHLAWELFCNKAFKECQGICPRELEQLSSEIVRKCRGLPLVIATIASLLSTKDKVESEWRRVLDGLNSKVGMNSQFPVIQKILSLSYYDLPNSVRSCFLYFGVFPEDYSIYDEKFFKLWIADGFVKANGEKTLEEVAEEYLSELTKRNLVIFHSRLGEGNMFRVHDLMRDVILSRADDIYFCQTWDKNKLKSRGKGRRLTISGSTEDILENVDSSGVRSVFFFDVDDQLTEAFMVKLFKKFKLLEVLDVDNAPVDTLPKEVGKLFCSKYFSLSNTRVKVLPKSISKLHNLESLDIRDTLICELPKEIIKLRNLRHLLAYRYNYNSQNDFDFVHGVAMHEGFGQLEDLQSLTLVEADIGGVRLVKDFEKLTKLRWLDLQHISSPPRFLCDLLLTGRLEKLPEWILKLQNLRGLCLCHSRLIDEPVKCLKGLTNLENLELSCNAYEGEQLYFEDGGFQKLRRIVLYKLDRLKVVKVVTGALPVLEDLSISECSQLEEVPSIRHLSNLKYAVFNGRRVY
ncbi:hypothetical protein TIFTF001_041082 [Ficus carica]|uniref:NB-ARC domain-containing protein n=1 Tax=Ficus carica TaxID=3494 RepID=A0AA87Z385_FICCA|nr:hypothetical protein TIFTF001_041082 [Ficus carica]